MGVLPLSTSETVAKRPRTHLRIVRMETEKISNAIIVAPAIGKLVCALAILVTPRVTVEAARVELLLRLALGVIVDSKLGEPW